MSEKPVKQEYFYFVDDKKYETDQAVLTGAQIKAQIPNLDRTYSLVLEGTGKEPDQIIGDDTPVSLKKDEGPKRFTLVPPATFGG
jgi:hypothetical protein